jgi:hypothetical protein
VVIFYEASETRVAFSCNEKIHAFDVGETLRFAQDTLIADTRGYLHTFIFDE